MKQALIAILVLLVLGFIAAAVYVVGFMDNGEEDGDTAPVGAAQDETNGTGESLRRVETEADLLDALDAATERNQDTVGWLRVPGTKINNCVLQSHDNEAYLGTNEKREYDLYGCYFVDYECFVGERDILSPNTIIYGHSDMTDNPEGKRFSQLFHFKDEEFAKNTPVVTFSTMGNTMQWQVFAVFFTDVDFNYIEAEPADGVQVLAKAAMEKSLYDYGVTVGKEDKILTLSTCSGKNGMNDRTQRFVVMAKLMPEDFTAPKTADLSVRESGTEAIAEESPAE